MQLKIACMFIAQPIDIADKSRARLGQQLAISRDKPANEGWGRFNHAQRHSRRARSLARVFLLFA
jgi:hypothetical protein